MTKLTNAPIQQPMIIKSGLPAQVWSLWFTEVVNLLSGRRPIQLSSYTVLGLPSPVGSEGCLVYVSNATGGSIPAFSDGTDWRRVDDRTIVA